MLSKETFNLNPNDKSYLLSHNNLTLDPTHTKPTTSTKILTPKNDFNPKSMETDTLILNQKKSIKIPKSTTDLTPNHPKRSKINFSIDKRGIRQTSNEKRFNISNIDPASSVFGKVKEEGELYHTQNNYNIRKNHYKQNKNNEDGLPSFRGIAKVQNQNKFEIQNHDEIRNKNLEKFGEENQMQNREAEDEIMQASIIKNHNRKDSEGRFDRFQTFSHKQWTPDDTITSTINPKPQNHLYTDPTQRKSQPETFLPPQITSNQPQSNSLPSLISNSQPLTRHHPLTAIFYHQILTQIETIEQRFKLLQTVNHRLNSNLNSDIKNLESLHPDHLILKVSKQIDQMENAEKRLKKNLRELKSKNKNLDSENAQKSAEIQKLLIKIDKAKISSSNVRNRSIERNRRLERKLKTEEQNREMLEKQLGVERVRRNEEAQKNLELRKKNQEIQKNLLGERSKMLEMKKKYLDQIEELRKGVIDKTKEKQKEEAKIAANGKLGEIDMDYLGS